MEFSKRKKMTLLRNEIMFCPQCGLKNKDEANYCAECGSRIRPMQIAEPSKNATYQYNPNPWMIGFGFIIIASLYLMPIIPIGNTTITLGKYFSICNNPLGNLVYGCSNSVTFIVFYIGWILAVLFIVGGLFNKTTILH